MSFLWLTGRTEVIRERLDLRFGHFMPSGLLTSQLRDLQPPLDEPDVRRLNVERPREILVHQALMALAGRETPCF